MEPWTTIENRLIEEGQSWTTIEHLKSLYEAAQNIIAINNSNNGSDVSGEIQRQAEIWARESTEAWKQTASAVASGAESAVKSTVAAALAAAALIVKMFEPHD